MPVTEVLPADLRLVINPEVLGFANASALLDQALPWIGQARAQLAARFGLEMQQPDYTFLCWAKSAADVRPCCGNRCRRLPPAGRCRLICAD